MRRENGISQDKLSKLADTSLNHETIQNWNFWIENEHTKGDGFLNRNDILSFMNWGVLCLTIMIAGCASFPLHQAIQGGETDKASILVAKGKYIDSYDRGGNTPLAWAANRENIEVMKQLVEAGADVNQKNKGTFDTTPLYVAASENRIDAAKFLIEHGADVNLSLSDGATPLMIAAEKGYDEIVEVLVENSANMEAQNTNGVRALSFAAWNGHLKIVETLLAKGADINFFTKNEIAPLHEAATAGHLDVVKLLLAKGADINMPTQLGDQTALTQAAWKGHEHVVEYLVDQGADINAGKPRTALLLAMKNNDLPMVDFLINHGALPQVATDTKDEVYATARIHAWFGDEEVRKKDRAKAVNFYNIAAGYFEQAKKLFSEAVNQVNQEIKTARAVDFWGNVFLSALEGVAGAAANAQAHSNYRQWSQIGALRDASSGGTGMSGYYTALSTHQKAYQYNHKAFYGSPGNDLLYPDNYDGGYTETPLEEQKLRNAYLIDASS